MKRRTFTVGLGALFAAPAMPAAAVRTAPAAMTQHFAKAKLLARCHGSASPTMLGRLMKLDGDTARGVFEMLNDRGVVSHGLDGIARAANPLNTHCIPSEAIRQRDLATQVSKTRDQVKNIWERFNQDVDTDTAFETTDDVELTETDQSEQTGFTPKT